MRASRWGRPRPWTARERRRACPRRASDLRRGDLEGDAQPDVAVVRGGVGGLAGKAAAEGLLRPGALTREAVGSQVAHEIERVVSLRLAHVVPLHVEALPRPAQVG